MKEIADIVAAYETAVTNGKRTALATVVLVEGSAYRRPGARMLITEDGYLTGAISGGCLEGDALRKARLVIMQQEPMLVTYDTMDDDDAKLGVGLGCNGIIHILIEPVSEQTENPIKLLQKLVDCSKSAVLLTLFSINERKAYQPGTCLFIDDEGLLKNNFNKIDNQLLLIHDGREALREQRSETKIYDGEISYTAFIEYITPPVSLVIIGAGNDAIPLTRIAGVLGWDVTIVDGRHNYAIPERFPSAKRIIVSRAEEVMDHLTLNDQTVFVMMTHNYNYEMTLLKILFNFKLQYVGMLGPKKKLERMLGEIEDNGNVISKENLEMLYGPVGLDIGSESPEEIALSIAAEIKAVLSSRQGYSLKHKQVSIHSDQSKIA